MTVGGGEDYTFTGGGIHAGAGNVQPDAGGVAHITDATGKLVKTGAGTLTLANAANTFTGGVEIDGGVLAFSRGDQLATPGGAGIAFHGGGTLRAAADLALDAAVSVAPGVTAVIDSAGHALALGGALTGAADSALAKTGDGALALGADLGGFSGTLAVRAGVVRAGAAGLLTAASDAGAVISIDAGATLDLDGHDQTLARLQGAGTVGLGPARLTMDIGADTGFAGGFAGAGTVVKQGAGKWTLSGPSSHTGGVILEEGRLGLAHNEALGAGALTVTAPAAALDIEADGLAVANDIAAGSNTLTLATRGRGAEFSGKISGGRLVIEGTGTLALSGNNTVALEINNARTIAKRAESIADAADIRDGSVLEFQDVGSGQVRGSLRGGRVLFTSSTLSLNGANTLRAFTVGADSRITAAAVDALGGAAAAVRVAEGGWLKIVYPGTPAGGMDVDGGALVFAPVSGTGMSSVALSGALNFTNGGEIRLDGIMPTGIYTAAVAYGGIPRPPAYDPHQGGMFMVADIVNGDTLRVTAYNKALEPGKDIVVGFDALLAATRAVYSHVSEEFIAPFSDKAAGPDGRALWFRAIGSFAEYGDDAGHLGHTAASYGGIVGYDWISSRDLMAGVYAGYTAARLETTNNATTDMGLPHLGFYGALRRGKLYAAADVNLGSGSADTVRREDHGNTVTGSYNLDHAGAKLEVGCTVPLFARGSLRPSLGLHYMSLDFRHYAETGQGAVRLDNLGARTVQAVFGCDAAKEITTAWGLPGMVDLSAGWRQRIHAKITDAWATLVAYPDARLQIRGDDYDSSGVTAGVGLRLALSRRMLFALAYDFDYIPAGNHDNDTIRHTFNSLIRLSW
ncbi:MAG: autotransporter domain-containing protein [Opitutaceae bacterium]|nr:autotransporter domain-containing protein [Opitutaceae bacterium]